MIRYRETGKVEVTESLRPCLEYLRDMRKIEIVEGSL